MPATIYVKLVNFWMFNLFNLLIFHSGKSQVKLKVPKLSDKKFPKKSQNAILSNELGINCKLMINVCTYTFNIQISPLQI